MSNPDYESRAHALIHSAILPSETHGPLWGGERLWEVLKLGEGERSTQPVTWEAVRVSMMWLQPKDSDSNQEESWLESIFIYMAGKTRAELQPGCGGEEMDERKDEGRGSASTF